MSMSIEKLAGVVAVLLGLMTYIALLGVVEDITVPVSDRQATVFWMCFVGTVGFTVIHVLCKLENRK